MSCFYCEGCAKIVDSDYVGYHVTYAHPAAPAVENCDDCFDSDDQTETDQLIELNNDMGRQK